MAGRQVEGSWGRLGTRPCLGAELSFRQVWAFLPGWGEGGGGVGLSNGAEGLGWGSLEAKTGLTGPLIHQGPQDQDSLDS